MSDNVLAQAPDPGTGGLVAVGILALIGELATTALVLAPEALPLDPSMGLLMGLLLGGAELAPETLARLAGLLGHALLCAALILWVRARARKGRDLRLAGLMLVTTPVLGPLGPLFTLLTTGLHALFRRYATGFQDWYLSLFPESEIEPAQELYELIVSGRETAHLAAGESFTDVMSVGTPQQKQAVIALVARHFRPAFTPALKAGLGDADPSVRVQAATATARVEHEFNGRWQTLDNAVRTNPDAVATRAELARHLDNYAFCGLLDSNREAEIRDKALDGYRRCLDLAPDDDEIRHDLGRLLLRCGLAEEAALRLEPLIDRATDRRILFWYAESLFRLKRYADLRALPQRRADLLGEGVAMPDTLRDVFTLWRDSADQPDDLSVREAA